MANQRITLDASQCPALTNQVGFIPLTNRNCRFGDFASNGRDLQLYDSDQSTTITHSLRTWNTGGLRLIDRIGPPTSLDPQPYVYAIISVSGNLGFGNDPHTIRAWGGPAYALPIIPDQTLYGLWNCYDKFGTLVWTFQTPSHNYPMSCIIADIDGDGLGEVIVGCAKIDHHGYVLNGTDGTVRWSWDLGSSVSGGNGSYCRVSGAGNLRHDLSGLEVIFGGSDGKLAMLASTGGSPIWSIVLSHPQPNQSVQDALIDDLDNSGQAYIYCVQGEYIRKIDNTGATTWTYIHTRAGTFYNNYYAISSGHITSTTTRQIVAASAGQDSTFHLGVCTVLDSTGSVAWEKSLPYPCFAVGCGDVNGDGYDEVLLSFGTNVNYQPDGGWGGLLVLDRNGNELFATSFGAASKNTNFGDSNGDGVPEILVACDDGHHYRYAYDLIGATIKAVIPSISSASTPNLYIGSAGSSIIPSRGDYLFDLSGADGSSPTGWTQQRGAWTIQGGKLQSPDDGDTSAGIQTCELAGSSTDALEFEFDAYKVGQGTGIAADYYVGVRYRCVNWSGGYPAGYYIQIGAKGNLSLLRSASGTATPAATVYSNGSSGLTFNTTDVVRFRVVASGISHSLAYQKNESAWKILYETSDSGGPTAAGSVAFTSNRGQARYENIVLWSIPSAFCDTFPGPSPIYVADTSNASFRGTPAYLMFQSRAV